MSRFEFSSTKSESSFSFEQSSGDNTGGGDDLPSRLKDHDQWLVTEDKKPVTPSKGWQNSVNQLFFTEAQDRAKDLGGEVAFCFTDDGPFVGFDLDDVKQDNQFSEEALDLVERLDTYTEVSTSSKGLHIIAEGERVDDRKNRADLSEAGHLEIYDKNRYFVLTGEVYSGFTSVESRPTVVGEVQNDHLFKERGFSFTGRQKPVSGHKFDGGETDASPEQIRRTIQTYAESDDHAVDREVLRLWQGSDEGRESPSEADMAFVKQLYYWCRGDQNLMDECFRASGRMRQKWDEQRSDQTYGEMTIHKVCRTNSDTFGGRYVG